MRNGFARLKEAFPNEYVYISSCLVNAIRKDNADVLDQLISTYFSSSETSGFLDGAIAVYIDDDKEVQIHTPAILALRSGSRNAMRAILRTTRNPNAREDPDAPENSLTLLMIAVINSDFDTAKLLLEEGANVNEECVSIDEDGGESSSLSALSFAVESGLTKTTNLLLDNGAVPTLANASSAIRTSDGLDPLLVKMIELRPELLHGQTDNVSLLHLAAMSNNLPSIKWLLDQGASLNAISEDGTTPLDWAVDVGKKEIAAFLQSVGGVSGKQDESPDRCELPPPANTGGVTGKREVSPALQNSSATKQEITKLIERLELLEEKFGIAISGLYATCKYESYGSPPYHKIEINFDLTSLSDGKLERSFNVIASAYNSAGQLLKTDSTRIYADDFMGFSPVSITLHLDQSPEKIRLFPAA
jgi:ankyrin repeat protein